MTLSRPLRFRTQVDWHSTVRASFFLDGEVRRLIDRCRELSQQYVSKPMRSADLNASQFSSVYCANLCNPIACINHHQLHLLS